MEEGQYPTPNPKPQTFQTNRQPPTYLLKRNKEQLLVYLGIIIYLYNIKCKKQRN
jgi:hypothetical protein